MKTTIASPLLTIYFILLSCVFPLFFTNYYYNLQLSKSMFFIISTYLALIATVIFPTQQPSCASCFSLHKSPEHIFLFLFTLSALLSACFSDFGLSAFTGASGRYVGFFTILAMAICFSLFSSSSFHPRSFSVSFSLTGGITALLGILQFIQIDVLGLSDHVPALLKGMYLSTIGHINIFSGYVSMTLVFCIASYCLYGKRILLLPSLIGYIALFAANSDTGFLCIGVILIVLFSCLRKPVQITRLFDQLILLAFSCFISHGLSHCALIPYQGIPSFLSQPILALALILFSLSLRLIHHRFITQQAQIRKFQSFFTVVLTVTGGILLILFLLANTHLADISLLRMDDSWGSFRGFIWRKVIEVYQSAPIWNKLFGYGPDTLKPLLLSICKDEMLSTTGKIYDSAHHDFLQYLITTGVFGSLSWLAFWISVLVRSVKHYRSDMLPWLIVLIAYLIQTLFIPTQPITAPLGFMAAGICIGMSRNTEIGSE